MLEKEFLEMFPLTAKAAARVEEGMVRLETEVDKLIVKINQLVAERDALASERDDLRDQRNQLAAYLFHAAELLRYPPDHELANEWYLKRDHWLRNWELHLSEGNNLKPGRES